MQLQPVMKTAAVRTALRHRFDDLLKPAVALSVVRGYVSREPIRARSSPVRDRPYRFLLRVDVKMIDGAREAYALKGYADLPDGFASANGCTPGEQLAEFYRSLSCSWLQRGERCPVIAPLGYSRDKKLLVIPWVHGVSLEEAIRCARAGSLTHAIAHVPRVLAQLHATQTGLETPITAEAMVQSTVERWEQLYERVPDTRELLIPLIDLLQAALPRLKPSSPALVHGDAKPGHFLFDGRRWLLLDLDTYGYADPAYDVGNLLAKLEVECLGQPAFAAQAKQRMTTMENACLRAMPEVAPPSVAFFYGLTLIRKVLTRLFKVPPAERDPRWAATVAHVAMRACEALSAPLSVRTRILEAEEVSPDATDNDLTAVESDAIAESEAIGQPEPITEPGSIAEPEPIAPPEPITQHEPLTQPETSTRPDPIAQPEAPTQSPATTHSFSPSPALESDDAGDVPKVKRPRRSLAAVMTIVLSAVFIGGAGTVWYQRLGGHHASTYLATRVERGDIEDAVSALGTLQPVAFVDVGTQVTGQLKTVYVTVGQRVRKGQLVAEIDPTLFASKVETTRASLENVKALLSDKLVVHRLADQTYQRNLELYAKNAASEEILQQSKAALDQASAQIESLQAQVQAFEAQLKGDRASLAYTKIFAPMSGTVVSLTSRVGQTLVATQQAPIILRIADLNTMTVWAQVSEADVPKIALGMPVYFSTIGLPNRRWHSQVRQILPTPENVNNVILYDVLFDVSNPDLVLQPGMSAQASFVVAEAKNALVVPVSALSVRSPGWRSRDPAHVAARTEGQTKKRQYFVRVLQQDGRIEERPVKVGLISRVNAEIAAGLTEGESVIVGTEDGAVGKKSKAQPHSSVGRI